MFTFGSLFTTEAGRGIDQKNIHHRATETLRKTKSKAGVEHTEVAEARRPRAPRSSASPNAAAKLKRLELLEILQSGKTSETSKQR